MRTALVFLCIEFLENARTREAVPEYRRYLLKLELADVLLYLSSNLL